MNLGTLEFLLSLENLSLTAPVVAEALKNLPNANEIGVAEIDPTLSDTAAFCEHYQIDMREAANCVVLEAKRSDQTWFAACVVLGSTRADVNGLARRTLEARRVSFAPMEIAVAQSSMEYGAITPVGLPTDWPILVDSAVAGSNRIIIGSGIRKSKLLVPGHLFATLPNVRILENLGKTLIEE